MKKDFFIGKKFNKLTVKSFLGLRLYYGQKRRFVLCKCDCGNKKELPLTRILTSKNKSCGCLAPSHDIRHGLSGSRFHVIWKALFRRCNNKKATGYYLYGKKGIKVNDRWKNFINFRDDMYKSYLAHVKDFGEKNTSLDRIDGNKDYELPNCRWATWKEQARNKKNNKILQIDNEKMCVAAWAEKRKINEQTIRSRLFRNWTPEQALNFKSHPKRTIWYTQRETEGRFKGRFTKNPSSKKQVPQKKF